MKSGFLIPLVFVLAGALTGAAAGHATAGPAASPVGDWARGDGKARIQIGRCGKDLCAVNTWMRPDVRDEKVGDRLVMTIEPVDEDVWKGKAFDPRRHLTYHLTLKLAATRMTTSGCLLGGLICKTMGWTRLDEGSARAEAAHDEGRQAGADQ